MQYIIPDYYKEFTCIADQCEETCCAGWQIIIDPKSMRRYLSEMGPYRKSLLRGIDKKESAFRQKSEKRCAFLNDDNLCDMYTNLGPDSLCKTCRLYPRHIEEFEGVREITLSVSCPEAARILLSKTEPVHFLEYEKTGEEEYDDFDPFLYSLLLDARESMIKILQDRTLSIRTRAILILGMAHDMQTRINQGNLFDCQNVINRYECPAAAKYADSIAMDQKEYHFYHKMLQKLHTLEFLKEAWPDLLMETEAILYMHDVDTYKARCEEMSSNLGNTLSIQLEQLLVYFISTYFCGAVYDGEIFAKTQMAIICTRQIYDLWLARFVINQGELSEEEKVELIYRYSREIEHSDDNLKAYEALMERYHIPCMVVRR